MDRGTREAGQDVDVVDRLPAPVLVNGQEGDQRGPDDVDVVTIRPSVCSGAGLVEMRDTSCWNIALICAS